MAEEDAGIYRKALARTAELKKSVADANSFRLDSSISEAKDYFEGLRKSSPEIYELLRMRRKEIAELAIKRKTKKSVMLD
ncbi:MAG: hypothetical protein AB1324_03605 [Candidatus Micrarchaeota archaeon]